MINVAIFVRVSSKSQEYDRQIFELSEYAKNKGYNIVSVISEKITGSRKNKDREGIVRLLELARKKKISKVLVHEVSRIGRNSPETSKLMEELSELGVSIYTMHFNLETLNPDGSKNPLSHLIFGILKELASYERELNSYRIRSGQEAAKKKGIHIGRNAGTESTKAFLKKHRKVIDLLKDNISIRNIAKITKVSSPTIQKVKKLMQ